MTPDPQTVYRNTDGEPLLFVRTEQRPGSKTPEHLFVRVRNRVVLQLWMDETPEGAELVIDVEGRKQANQERWLRLAAEHNVTVLAGLLKVACQWLPRERAQELRQRYVEAQP
jgi:hypothetical protein